MDEPQIARLDAPAWSGDDAVAWMRALVGTVHRHAWSRDTEHPARAEALKHLSRAVEAAYLAGGAHRQLAILADLWLTLALDSEAIGTAWQIDDQLDGPLGAPLRRVLEARAGRPVLQELWRPVHFARARRRLAEVASRRPNLRASPAPEIWGEAREDAQALLRAAKEPSKPPPTKLRLLEHDPEAWASEPRGTHQLLRGVKVWNTLVEWMRKSQQAAQALVASWTAASLPEPPLPEDWREAAAALFPDDPGLAQTWLFDLSFAAETDPLPRLIQPALQAQALNTLARGMDEHARIGLLGLCDEVRGADPELDAPAWAVSAQEALARLTAEVDDLRDRARRRLDATSDPDQSARLHEVVDTLTEAAEHLANHQSREAADWVALARQTLDNAVHDAELATIEARAAQLHDRLKAAGKLPESLRDTVLVADEDAPEALHAAAEALEAIWQAEITRASAQLRALEEPVSLLHGPVDRQMAFETLQHAQRALDAQDLSRALRALQHIQHILVVAARAVEQRLDPALLNLLHRARRADLRPTELHGVEAELLRVRDRRDAGLHSDTHRQALVALVDAAERGTLNDLTLLVVGGEDDRLQPVYWWDSVVPVNPDRFDDGALRSPGVVPGKLYLVEEPSRSVVPTKLPARRERLVPVVRTEHPAQRAPDLPPHLKGWSGSFFVEGPHQVHGPYVVRGDHAEAADPRGLVAVMPARDFWDLFGLRTLPAFDHPERHVIDPPPLADIVGESGTLLDRQRPEDTERWLYGLLDGLDGVAPHVLSQAIARLEAMDLPEAILRDRLSRMHGVLAASRHLTQARGAAVRSWLAGPQGEAAIAEAARGLAAERTDLLDAAVLVERERVADQVAELRAEHQRAQDQLAKLREEVAAMEEVRDDARFALLAHWGVSGAAQPAAAPTPAPVTRAPEVDLAPVHSLSLLADQLADTLATPRDDVANLLLTMATGWWTLLAGPPGVGKSTLVRRFLHSLGQGPDQGRYLELVVRREWQDDAALFGFWHPGEQRWAPSSDGLVEHLLDAAAAHDRGDAGLFAVVLEELNLASPEYYLARPISALEDAHPRIRLYGDGLMPRNASRYPPSVPVHPNVRLTATVNIDETVERLSPRFLSRASVLWVSPDIDALLSGAPPAWPDPNPVRWSDVHSLAQQSDLADLGPIAPLARFLHEQGVPGAPTPRAVQGMRRYLSAATGVMDPVTAQDFQVLQRVMPGLHAVGPGFREVFDRLAELLQARGWTRSAAHARRLRAHGEAAGDYYDAFHG